MAWLVVLGSGSWSPQPSMRFRAGKHEVSDEVANLALSKRMSMLMVFEEEPEILQGVGPGPLTPEDIKVGTTAGVRLPDTILEEELEAEYEIPLSYLCQWCPEGESKYASQAMLNRHQNVHHPDFVRR